MFGLIRLALMLPIAFGIGILYERMNHADRCAQEGGQIRAGVCWNE